MADTPTTRLKLREIPLAGANNSWGDPYLNQSLQSIDDAVAGVESVTLNSTSKTLTTTNYETNEYRQRVHRCTGTPGGVATVTIPAVEYCYKVDNQTSGGYAVIWKTASGTGVYIPSGACVDVYCDGTDCYLGNQFSGSYKGTATFSAGTLTIDARTGDYFEHTVTANTTLAISNASSTRYTTLLLALTNGGAYNFTWPAGFLWGSGDAPTLTSSGLDLIAIMRNPGGTVFYGFYKTDML